MNEKKVDQRQSVYALGKHCLRIDFEAYNLQLNGRQKKIKNCNKTVLVKASRKHDQISIELALFYEVKNTKCGHSRLFNKLR